MATISNRRNKWQARVRRNGQPSITKTFLTKQDAERWARSIEIELDRGTYINKSTAEKTQFKDILQQYLTNVIPSMRSNKDEGIRVRRLMRHPIAQYNMAQLSPSHMANYRDERLKVIKPNTVIRELAVMSSIINHARREWGLNISNPVTMIKKPSSTPGRNRILNDVEIHRILNVLKSTRSTFHNNYMAPLVEFAIETAMRRSELTSIRWENVNLISRVAYLPLTKNGDSRYVPLSSKAISILNKLPRTIDGRVFPLKTNSVSLNFLRASRKADIPDIHFHDLRHVALTRMSSKISNVLELAAISGHRELKMLQRYTHIKAEDLVQKLG
jgi:integrase